MEKKMKYLINTLLFFLILLAWYNYYRESISTFLLLRDYYFLFNFTIIFTLFSIVILLFCKNNKVLYIFWFITSAYLFYLWSDIWCNTSWLPWFCSSFPTKYNLTSKIIILLWILYLWSLLYFIYKKINVNRLYFNTIFILLIFLIINSIYFLDKESYYNNDISRHWKLQIDDLRFFSYKYYWWCQLVTSYWDHTFFIDRKDYIYFFNSNLSNECKISILENFLHYYSFDAYKKIFMNVNDKHLFINLNKEILEGGNRDLNIWIRPEFYKLSKIEFGQYIDSLSK